jgi:hypothetical protein
MREAQPSVDADRRHPTISIQELRRQLIEADEERYRLRGEIAALSNRPPDASAPRVARPRGVRVAMVVAAALIAAGVGGLVWKMCPSAARAEAPTASAAVRVQSVPVTARILSAAPAAAAELRNTAAGDRPASPPRARHVKSGALRVAPHVLRTVWRTPRPLRRSPGRATPRPLSPGEFGKKAL